MSELDVIQNNPNIRRKPDLCAGLDDPLENSMCKTMGFCQMRSAMRAAQNISGESKAAMTESILRNIGFKKCPWYESNARRIQLTLL